MIYTSGSTGQPKGVEILHRGLANALLAIGRELGETAAGIMLAVTTISFDMATLELFMPLIHGGTVEIADETVCEDGAALCLRLETCGATLMQATPATWRMLVAAGWNGRHGLEIISGGEAMSRELADALIRRGARVWNMYGPTETTIYSTISQVEHGNFSVPIGRPIANTRAYVLDEQLKPVPVGSVGDLYLAGDGVARGYLNDPELTALRFLADPFRRGGERMSRLDPFAICRMARYNSTAGPTIRLSFADFGSNQATLSQRSASIPPSLKALSY